MKIIGEGIYLKLLSTDDVNEKYLRWMQDPEILEFLESRWRPFTIEDLKNYVRLANDGQNNFMFGIYLKENSEYIGNIKIGCISQIHRYGDVGLIIGEKSVWGRGYGVDAINLITRYAFDEINLNKVFAGIYANNMSSIKAFKKAGYREVGILKKHRFYKGTYADELLFEKCKASESDNK
jgi:RimJ/RimL family protein N-acetyltransferase